MGTSLIAFSLAAFGTKWLYVVVGIGLVIFVHELGHFLAAKLCGVKCEKFYIGFDPPLRFLPSRLFRFRWGETEYGIGIIPLGGYVKMLGQEDNPNKQAEEAERARVITQGPDGQRVSQHDPRSFLAKSVPQRLLIISAGVIMNLIFAVVFAAIAFRAKVDYEPVEIAQVQAGEPCWVANFQPGDKVIQVGRQGQPYEHLRWSEDFRMAIIMAGIRQRQDVHNVDLLVRSVDGQERWVELTPTDRREKKRPLVTVGASAVRSNVIAKVIPETAASRAKPALQEGDRIVKVDGESLPTAGENEHGDLPATWFLQQQMVARGSALTLTVERKGESQPLEVQLPPSVRRTTGIVMEIGPVIALQEGSPAAEAGVEVGDLLVSIAGEPVGDPLTLPDRLPAGGEPIELEVRRGDETRTISVTPREIPLELRNVPVVGPSAVIGLESLGLAYRVGSRVAEVRADAAVDGIRPGDEVVAYELVAEGEEAKRQAKEYGEQELLKEVLGKRRDLSGLTNWVNLEDALQDLPRFLQLRLFVSRSVSGMTGGGDAVETSHLVAPIELPEHFNVERGIVLRPMTRVCPVTSWGQAFALGFRETKERFRDVVRFVGLLFSGQVSLGNVGGPAAIFQAAGSQAEEGLGTLLLFLTFLSVNLAILNSLPIPVLDGGHAVFLIWEGVVGRPAPERLQHVLTLIGFFCLLLLMVIATGNDIQRIFFPG